MSRYRLESLASYLWGWGGADELGDELVAKLKSDGEET